MRSIEVKEPRSHFLVFDQGDELMDTLRRFAGSHRIRGARFSAIGAFEKATIAYWNWSTKQYEKHQIDEQREVASLTGDIAMEGGAIRIHAHVVLGRSDLGALAGHVIRAVIRPTLEMQLIDYGMTLERARREEINLSPIVLQDVP